MRIRTGMGIAAVIGLAIASPAVAASGNGHAGFADVAADTNSGLVPDANAKCDPKTGMDSSGVRCKGKAGDHSGDGNSATWVIAGLGIAALVGVVAALASHGSPASP